jgi:hypothetical protein
MKILRSTLSGIGRLLTRLWVTVSPATLAVTSGFGTWYIARTYFSRYLVVPMPNNPSGNELIGLLTIGVPVLLMIGTMRYLEEEARERGQQPPAP